MKGKGFAFRRMKYDSLAAAIAVVFLIAIVLLNFLVQTAARRLPLFVDLTENQAYRLSEQSIAFLESVGKQVSVIVLADEKRLESAGGYYLQAKEIIDQYPKYSSGIEVKYFDLAANPWIAAQYPDMDLKEYDILVCCGEETIKTSLASLFTVVSSQSTKEQYIQSSCAEQEITSAILRAASDKRERILLLTGQDEIYSDAFKELLYHAGYLAEEKNLLTDELDPDAKIAILFAPQQDLEVDMIKKVDEYLTNGGEYGRSLICALHPTAEIPVNLGAYLEQWGIKCGSRIVMESNPSRYMNNLPYACLVDYAPDDDTGESNSNTFFMSYMGKEMTAVFDSRSAYETKSLLSYSDSAYAMSAQEGEEREWGGDWAVLLQGTYTKYEGFAERQSSVFVFASAASFDTKILNNGSLSNRKYFAEMVGSLTGNAEVITTAPIQLESPSLGITQSEYYRYTILFVAILPASILMVGTVVWFRRRHR